MHLHPLLQRKLVKYLSDETDNQYFFTTHSAHLLDAVDSEIFHITQKNNVSCLQAISSTKQRSNIYNDLGYKASDILQANCIIWVEGPSDRIYLNFWINQYNSNLIEGVHYSIMFDSDKSHSRARISSTKQRLKNEFNSGNGFAWVTMGREVENYLNYDRIEESVLAVHPSAGRLVSKGQWKNLLKYYKNKGRIKITANKVKTARHMSIIISLILLYWI